MTAHSPLVKTAALLLLLVVTACATRETDVPWLENAPKIVEEQNKK